MNTYEIDMTKYQNQFCKHLQTQGKSFNTVKNYRTDLNIFSQFLASKGRSSNIKEVTVEQVHEYGHYLDKKYSSPNSIRRRVQALRLFFDYLIAQEVYDQNPIKSMLVRPKVVDLPNPPEFHVIKALFESLNPEFSQSEHEKLLILRNKVLIQLIFGAGLKVSDIEGILLQHIQFSKGQYRILIAPEKRDPFTVILPTSYNELHEDYTQLLQRQKKNDSIDFDHFLFNANPFKILNGGLSSRGIEIIFKEFSKTYKLQVTAKNFRQACIFKWLTQSIPESRIKEWMGVQPQYSLKPYRDLLEQKPSRYCYLDL